MNGLQKEIKVNEKVIKLDYFWGAVMMAVMMVSLSSAFPLSTPNSTMLSY